MGTLQVPILGQCINASFRIEAFVRIANLRIFNQKLVNADSVVRAHLKETSAGKLNFRFGGG